jgi:6,7-dimethyl-8-ribityllumazine synthase
MAPIKGPGEAQQHDGSGLRIAIVHARWNMTVRLFNPAYQSSS